MVICHATGWMACAGRVYPIVKTSKVCFNHCIYRLLRQFEDITAMLITSEVMIINFTDFMNCSISRYPQSNRARVGRPQTSSSPPVIFIAGRPKAALLFLVLC